MRTALTVAGSDSIGGAGLQADIKAMGALGVHAATVVTAVTAQNTTSVGDILPVPADMVQAQLDAVLSDLDIRAAKTGMLYDTEIVRTVADEFEDRDVTLVVDPVMVATVGGRLYDDGFVRAMRERLLPVCELVTPNLNEAEALTGIKIRNENDAIYACEILGKEGSSVLLKGGHMGGENVVDYLYLSSEIVRIKNRRLREAAGHGSGCTLSAYIVANLTNGLDLTQSVLDARKTIQKALATQYRIGKGVPVVNSLVRADDGEDGARVRHLRDLDDACAGLLRTIPAAMVPQAGCNIAYALPGANGPEDMAAMDGGIQLVNGKPGKKGSARYGVAEHLFFVLEAAMAADPDARCALSVAATGDVLEAAEASGMRIARAERGQQESVSECAARAFSEAGRVPDVLVTVRGRRRDAAVIGKDPSDVISKLKRLLRNHSRPSLRRTVRFISEKEREGFCVRVGRPRTRHGHSMDSSLIVK